MTALILSDFFAEHPSAALAFSGGTDSVYLLYAAKEAGAKVRPYFIKTAFQPAFELEDARRAAPELTVLELDVLEISDIANNPKDRCYHCKKAMFSLLKDRAAADGFDLLLDGTNASDRWEERPGMRALRELHVLSPLRMCGLTKQQIRQRSQQAGLFTWNKPAYACLATRIPAGTGIQQEWLSAIEAAESALASLGYRDFRVRLFCSSARVQLRPEQFPKTEMEYCLLRRALKPYFGNIFLDLDGR